MNTFTVVWIALPLFIGFSSYLLPRSNRFLALGMALVSLVYGLFHIVDPTPLTLNLVGNFGVILRVDELSEIGRAHVLNSSHVRTFRMPSSA